MAQPMGMGSDPVGILASSNELAAAAADPNSPPMIDALVEASIAPYVQAMSQNTQGGAPLSMAQGGLASEEMARGYRHGGVHYGQNPNRPARALGSPRPRPERVSPPPQLFARPTVIDLYKKRNEAIQAKAQEAKSRKVIPEGYLRYRGKLEPIKGVSGIGKSWSNEPGSGESSDPSSTSFDSFINMYGPNYTVGDGYSAPDSSSIMSINASGLEGSLTQGLDVAVPVVDPSFEKKGTMRLSDLVKESYNETRERWMGSPPRGARKPSESRVEAVIKGLGIPSVADDIFNDLSNSLKSLFSSDFANKYPDMDFGMLASSIDRMQKAHPEFKDEISDLSEEFITSNTSLLHSGLKKSTNSAAINLQNLVLKSLSNKYEIATHQDRIAEANNEAKAFLETDIGQGFASAEGGASDAAVDRSMGDLDTFGGLDTRDQLYQREFEEGLAQRQGENYPNLTADQSKMLALDPSDEEGFEEAVIPGAATATGPGAGAAEAAGTSPSGGGLQGPDEVIGGYNTAAAQAASILNTDKKAGSKDIAAFKKEFMEAMPKYEGMSEEEKGFLIAEAGLRVMAGKSSDAIANIAKGLQGLGPALMKGAKEERAWKRQVELSAAKYGLENVARDAAELRADAKADKQIFGKVFRVRKGQTFERNGEMLPEKSTVILTQGEIRNGTVDLSKLATESSIAAGLKAYSTRLKSQLDQIQKSETDPNKFEGSKKTYLKDSAQVRTNTAVTGYLKNALVALNTKDVTGFRGLGKDVINKIANATGMKEYSEAAFGKLTTKNQYIRFTEGATTKFIEGLISEGGKISDFERNLARELSGAIGTRLFDGVYADPSVLTGKIKSFISDLNSNTDLSLRSMALSEKIWSTRYNTSDLALRKQLGSYGQMLRESRRPLSGGRTGIAKGSLNWKDIINVDSDGKTLGLKQNYRSGK